MAQFVTDENKLEKCIPEEGETAITVPSGITVIGRDALCGLQNVISVTLPDSLKVICDGAFYGCSSLNCITLPESTEKLGSCAFAQCSSLKTIQLDDDLTEIGNSAFWGCTNLESIVITRGISKVGYNLFGGCISLTSVTLPNSITELDERAFKECSALTSITLPGGLLSIGNMAFLNCHSLRSVTVPDSVTSIGEKAFFMCESLSELEIPDSVTYVGGDAFSDSESVVVRSTVSGKPLYKAVTATDGSPAYNFILRNIWSTKGFDFAAQDNYFPALQDEKLQFEIAFSRLMYKVELSTDIEKQYLDFLHNNAEKVVRYCIDKDSDELLRFADSSGLITKDNISALTVYADEHGNTAVTAYLLSVAGRLNDGNRDIFSDFEL